MNIPFAAPVEALAATAESALATIIPGRLGWTGDLIRRFPLLSGAIAYLVVGAATAYFIRATSQEKAMANGPRP